MNRMPVGEGWADPVQTMAEERGGEGRGGITDEYRSTGKYTIKRSKYSHTNAVLTASFVIVYLNRARFTPFWRIP